MNNALTMLAGRGARMPKQIGTWLSGKMPWLATATPSLSMASDDGRHASAVAPWDRELERIAAEKLDQLYDRLSDRLEQDFRSLTELTTSQEQTLETIAGWLGISMPAGEQADDPPIPGEARAVWSNVSRAACVNLLRTASKLAAAEAGVGRQSADDFVAMSYLLSPHTDNPTLTLNADQLADEAWTKLDRVRFTRLTGMSEDNSHLALRIAAYELVAWAGDRPTVIPHDDAYLVVCTIGDSLEAMVTQDRPGLYLWPEQENPSERAEIFVRSFAGDISKDVEGEIVHATPRIAKIPVEELALTAAAPSTSLAQQAGGDPLRIGVVDQIKGSSTRAAFSPFGQGWILGEER